ncbi:hypothetical protein GCM10027020_35870 [Nocardioides salsibiostraticola]
MTPPSFMASARPRTLLIGVTVLAVVALAGVLGSRMAAGGDESDLETALTRAPEEGQRFSFTDWAGVRAEMGLDLGSPTIDQVTSFLNAGFDADLTSNTALVESAEQLQRELGFSPASIEWELFSQDSIGAAVIVRLPSSFDFEVLGRNLTRLDYQRPKKNDEGDIWRGSADQIALIGGLSPVLTYIGLVPDQHLLVASDTPDTAERALKAARSPHDLDEGLADVTKAAGNALSASVYSGDYACEALAMAGADPTDQDAADELLQQAGKVNPMTAFSISAQRGMDVRVAMGFENADQAKTNATTRSVLVRGPAPGQGGDFTDRFTVDEVAAEDRVVTMDLTPAANSFVLSDLSNGPVLFATC